MSGNSFVPEMSFHRVRADVTARSPRPTRWIAAVIVSGVVGWHGARADQPAPDNDGVRLGKVPAIAFAPRRPLDAAQTARIKGLIRSLAKISKPDFGDRKNKRRFVR
jgi:hypothetical protein